jgi:hypothetical protein
MLKRLLALAIAGALSLAAALPAAASQGSGCMPTTGIVSGLSFAQAVNAAVAALISSNSGASAPATDCSAAPVKGQMWLDTSSTPNVMRQYDGTSWVALGALDSANHLWAPPVGGGSATVTAAATTDLCASPSAVQTITGTTAITSFGTNCPVGIRKTLIFASATPLTYNATSLILPGQRSYTAVAGDAADAIYLGAGNWRVLTINKIDGSSVVNPALPLGTVLYGDFATIPEKTVIADGRALSRAAYPDYLAAVTRVQTGTLTAGNNTITSVGNTRGLGYGMPIEGAGIQAGTTIASVTSTTITMSQPATANGSKTITAFLTGYGNGGDSTTVGVKNCVGKTMAGLDLYTAKLANAAVINSSQGSATAQLTTNELPAHSHSITDPGHQHYYGAGQPQNLATGNFNLGLVSSANGSGAYLSQLGYTGITATNSAGSGNAFSIVQPTSIAECVQVVLP